MEKLTRRINLRDLTEEEARANLTQEWLVTNGLGGYASGTISGAVSWRYHGLLIAALPSPHGRIVMLNHLAESLRLLTKTPEASKWPSHHTGQQWKRSGS